MNRHNYTIFGARLAATSPHGEVDENALWLGGEAMIAPAYVADLQATMRADNDCADPLWQTF